MNIELKTKQIESEQDTNNCEPLCLGICTCKGCGRIRFEWKSYFKCPDCECRDYEKGIGEHGHWDKEEAKQEREDERDD